MNFHSVVCSSGVVVVLMIIELIAYSLVGTCTCTSRATLLQCECHSESDRAT